MRTRSIGVVLVFGLATAPACGGGEDGLPLIAGTVEGSYDGASFTAEFGFATVYDGSPIIGLGDGDLHCGSPEANAPPGGRNVVIAPPALEVGTFASVYVNLYENVDEFEGIGSNGGTLELTAVTADSVAGTIAYDLTDDDGARYTVDGAFEVERCPE